MLASSSTHAGNSALRCDGALTPSSSSLSSLCRGITVTSSISHRKPTSLGTRPGGRGRAIACRCASLKVTSTMCPVLNHFLSDLRHEVDALGASLSAELQSANHSLRASTVTHVCLTLCLHQWHSQSTTFTSPAAHYDSNSGSGCAACPALGLVSRRQHHRHRALPSMSPHSQVSMFFLFSV